MQRVAIHSVPRSGSTWLGELFNSNPDVIYKYQPLFSYAFKSRLTPLSTKSDIIQFFNDIALKEDDFLDQKEARKNGKMPVFEKANNYTTIVYKEVRYHHILENLLKQDSDIKIIGLIRNPFAVIHSWLNAPKEFRKDLGWNEMEEWKLAPKKNLNKPEEFNGFEKWKEAAFLFTKLEKEYPKQFKIVFYHELLNNTTETIKELFRFCNLEFTKNTQEFITESQVVENKDAYSVYKTKLNDDEWKGLLNPIIINEIEKELMNTELEKYCKK
ncbi:MAG: hypothetical protein KFKLKKLM_01907 [Flavobacteriales bacterium]|nr:hypothetical protein [Flavobacteriales bacterium]